LEPNVHVGGERKVEMLLLKANKLSDQINEECESMDRSDYWRMVQEQDRDPEWQFMDRIVLNGTDDNVMKMLILKQKMYLAWIRKWKAKHINELTFCSEVEQNGR